ncbi:hypothetical protein E4U57_000539 [Claviceps arundinis]|uniref:Uncharacterized protein n=1 Tax=Claviceps arundinis TaxID=1623583 RepID=A0ABQ7PCJ8_9HYPO|nr:hypothetical protein E4U57_000539 [Claviceps arundinis]
MAFSAHASRARNIGVGNQPSHASNVHIMGPMTPRYFRNVMSEDPQLILPKALAQWHFSPSGPPTTAPLSMVFSAHASRARNIGVVNQPSRASPVTNIHVMDSMTPRPFRNVMSEDSDPRVTIQTRLTAAALAQVKHLADPGDIPQYPIDELAPPCHPDCLNWILH